MADQNKADTVESLYNEILSPSELFAARSRSHKVPVRGQKDFFPDGSEEQRQRLEQSLNEHWSLISEERVERLGSLVKGAWIPNDQVVELQSPAGKFWQTMGFSASGKQCLLPEEALYLMECGNLQVFYKDLPLSIQDGSEPSAYARQLNLPQSSARVGRQLKRKRSASPTSTPTPTPSSSHTEAQEECTSVRMEEDSCSYEGEKDKDLPVSQLTASRETSKVHTATTSTAAEGRGSTWWRTDVLGDWGHRSGHSSTSGSSCWDFSSIHFPDLGSREHLPSCLASPDPSLLPGALAVGVCDTAPWRRRINLRKVRMSSKEQKREEDKRRRRRDVNKDREVQRCRNWAEYQELLVRRQSRRKGRPAHLWNREVMPLHDPTQPVSTGELLDKISVIKSTTLLEEASRIKGSDEWKISFNVYQPDSVADFKKSNPGKPYARMCVCSFENPVPDLRAMKLLAFQSGDIPVVFAVVDHGDISFYTFKDFQLPTDVYL